ncbi:MAG: hypothetical protein AAFR63_02000 [Cyanobacteria bacterium J06631_6]
MIKIATEKINNWVYVTGVPRSGTTFVGKVLSMPLEVDYLHEPFNPQCGMVGLDRWYPYVRHQLDTEEMQSFDQIAKNLFSYDFEFKKYVPRKDPWQRKLAKTLVGSRGEFYFRMAKLNLFHRAAVIKDPIGNLLTEYLYHNFQVKPVIVVKHPLSFIASLKRVNWWIQTSWITEGQPHLIEDYFSDELDFIDREYNSLLEGSAAYWRATYKVLLEQADKYPDWQVVTIEELSNNPIEVFQKLYSRLELPWSNSVQRQILKLTQSSNNSTDAQGGKVQDFNRNSKDIFAMRRKSLADQERQLIFDIVQDVALKVYPESSFSLNEALFS